MKNADVQTRLQLALPGRSREGVKIHHISCGCNQNSPQSPSEERTAIENTRRGFGGQVPFSWKQKKSEQTQDPEREVRGWGLGEDATTGAS